MAKYVVANRRSGLFTADEKVASRATVQTTINMLTAVEVVGDHQASDPLGRHVTIIDAEPGEIEALRQTFPADAIVEPVIRRQLHRSVVPIELQSAVPLAAPSLGGGGNAYQVTITAGGGALANVPVIVYLQAASGAFQMTRLQTDSTGTIRTAVPQGLTPAFIEPIPYAGFWIMLVAAPPSGSTVDCMPIPKAGATGGGWWHDAIKVDLSEAARGSGIKVGVIDTGCGPHPNLQHVALVGAFIDGAGLPAGQASDVGGHGSHTSGIVGARPTQAGDYSGVATGCDLFHARVFKGEEPQDGPTQADITNAIDALSRDHQCDLINMSFGGGPSSDVEKDAIRDAAERGTLCVCSAGNTAGAIDFPAAYADCAAVSAIGKGAAAPTGTFAAHNQPSDASRIGHDGLFLARFSCFGSTLACTAPGVGIISTVPDRNGFNGAYMEMDGTSMASPAACAALAVILAKDAAYRALPRDITRTERARMLLAQVCRDIGLVALFEGSGLPTL